MSVKNRRPYRGKKMKYRDWNTRKLSYEIVIFWSVYLFGRLVHATVPCIVTEDCERILRPGSVCTSTPEGSFCDNPFQRGGCLRQMMPAWEKIRVCTSEDPPDAAENGFCRSQDPRLADSHMEIRIASNSWESSFFETWILQIVLSEILNVPVTVETGFANKSVDFYDPMTRMDYGTSNPWDCLKNGAKYGDCTERNQDEYEPCCHFSPEYWLRDAEEYRKFELAEIVEPSEGMGTIGIENWFIPKLTGVRDPTLLSYLGIAGEQHRRKLAERFLRPTTWKDYCELVSPSNCTKEENGVAKRPPQDETENDRMFVEGLYTGHFRKTDKNDCDKNPTTCTGHIADYPTGWNSNVLPLTHYLNIALESDGNAPLCKGYTYSQLTEMWAAANATKSDLIMQWWRPEALYQQYMNTDIEFQAVALPPPTQECFHNRISSGIRCSGSFEERIGDPRGACGEAPHALQKITGKWLYDITNSNPSIPEAIRSPGYDTLKRFSITEYQLGEIFDLWLSRETDKWNYDPREATCKWVVDNFHLVQSFIPRGHPKVLMEADSTHTFRLQQVAIVVASLAVWLVFSTAVVTYKLRARKAIVYAQTEFLWLLLIGLSMVSVASVLLAIPSVTNSSCTASVWLTNAGYNIELIPLIVKMGAIHKLMRASRTMLRVKLNRRRLFLTVAVLCTLMIIFLTIWTVIDPFNERFEYLLTDEKNEDGASIIMVFHYCDSTKSNIWGYISIVWHFVLLFVATVQTYLTRKIRRELNESRQLAFMIYSHFGFVTTRFITIFLKGSISESVLMYGHSLIYSCDAIVTIWLYFIPKFLTTDEAYDQESLRLISKYSSVSRLQSMPMTSEMLVANGSAARTTESLSRSVNSVMENEPEAYTCRHCEKKLRKKRRPNSLNDK